jgi:hypothetical protein
MSIQKIQSTEEKYQDAFLKNDIQTMKNVSYGKIISPMQCGMFIDTSLESGNAEMAKFLVTDFKCQPSLYAKQMAHVNGHHSLSLWMDSYATQRNDTDIKTVHYRPKSGWSPHIPEKYRY